jgi:phospholipid transport system transporter-binding protein
VTPEPPAADGTVFRATADGRRWIAVGALTFANAGPALAAARALPLPTDGVVACDGITAVDSAAVAVLLALKRRAAAAGAAIAFANVPAVLTSLADLYGVDDVITT